MSPDFDNVWEIAWPWIWPSLIVVAWLLVWLTGFGRFKEWIHRKVNPQELFGFEDKLVDRSLTGLFVGALLLGAYCWIIWAPLPPRVTSFVQDELQPWLFATLILAAFVTVGFYAVRRGLLWFSVRAKSTESKIDNHLVSAFNRPALLTVLLLGINLWAGMVPVNAKVELYVGNATKTAIVVLIVLLVDGLVQSWLAAKTEHSKVLQTSGSVLRIAVRFAIYTIGGLMALSSLGIDVTPILASLGVTSIAIGLALQSTLEDFLAGLLLAADQPVAIGDFIELEGGNSGTVLTIGWRTTRIRTRDAMHIVVPNSKLAKSTLTNRSRPTEICRFVARCGVAYSSDLDRVVALVKEVATELQHNDSSAHAPFEPVVAFEAFGASSVDFLVWLCARDWESHFGLKDRFIRKLHRCFAANDVVIPFPIRTLDMPPGTRIEVAPAKDTEHIS